MSLLSTSPIIHGASDDAAASCHASGYVYFHGNETRCPKGSHDCCVAGERYPRFRCSPPDDAGDPDAEGVRPRRGDGGAPTSCDMLFHRNTQLVVALSSGWLRLGGARRCNRRIRVFTGAASGRSVVVKVVDECDSVNGCREEHGFAPPCRNNAVGGSPAVWKKLGLNASVGEFEVVWSDAWRTPKSKSKHKFIKKTEDNKVAQQRAVSP
uniref:Ripening-related protein 4 n=1 Tax=Oryza glumipatula TaxID=40148 RepID=A0A0E0BBH8_9ORYZ